MKKLLGKASIVLSSLAIVMGGAVVTAGPANAVGGCSANSLCLYAGTSFTDKRFTTSTVSRCWALYDYGLTNGNPPAQSQILSWASTLPVEADLYMDDGGLDWRYVGNILPGHFSSNTGGQFASAVVICTGGHAPYWP